MRLGSKKVFLWILLSFVFFIPFSSSINAGTCVPNANFEYNDLLGTNDFLKGCFQANEDWHCEVQKIDGKVTHTFSELQEGAIDDCNDTICKVQINDVAYCANVSIATCNVLGGFLDYSISESHSKDDGFKKCSDLDPETKNITIFFNNSVSGESGVQGTLSYEGTRYVLSESSNSTGYLVFEINKPTKNYNVSFLFEKEGFSKTFSARINEDDFEVFDLTEGWKTISYESQLNVSYVDDVGFYGTVSTDVTSGTKFEFIIGAQGKYTSEISHTFNLTPGIISVYGFIIGQPPIFKAPFTLEQGGNEDITFNFSANEHYQDNEKTITCNLINISNNKTSLNGTAYLTRIDDNTGKEYYQSTYFENGSFNFTLNYNSSFEISVEVFGYNIDSNNSHYKDITDDEVWNLTAKLIDDKNTCELGDYFVGTISEGSACSHETGAVCHKTFTCDDGECKFDDPITFAKQPNFCDGNFFCNEDSQCVIYNKSCTSVLYNNENIYSFEPGTRSQKANCVLSKNQICEDGSYVEYNLTIPNNKTSYCSRCGHDPDCGTDMICDYNANEVILYYWVDSSSSWQMDSVSDSEIFCKYCPGDPSCVQDKNCTDLGYSCCEGGGVGPILSYSCSFGDCHASCISEVCSGDKLLTSTKPDIEAQKRQMCLAKGGRITGDCCSVDVDHPNVVSCPGSFLLNSSSKNEALSVLISEFPLYEKLNFCYCGDSVFNFSSDGNKYCCGHYLSESSCLSAQINGNIYFRVGTDSYQPYEGKFYVYLEDLYGNLIAYDELDSSNPSDYSFSDISPGEYILRLDVNLGKNYYSVFEEITLTAGVEESIDLNFTIDIFLMNLQGMVRDENEDVIDNAKITHNKQKKVSDSEGKFNYEDIFYKQNMNFEITGFCDGLYHFSNTAIKNYDLNDLVSSIDDLTINPTIEDNFTLKTRDINQLNFNITNSTGSNISDVLIKIINYPESCFDLTIDNNDLTNTSGLTNLRLPCNNTYTFSISKDGFQKQIIDFRFNCSLNDNYQLNLSLNRSFCDFDAQNPDLIINSINYSDNSVNFSVDTRGCNNIQNYYLYAKETNVSYIAGGTSGFLNYHVNSPDFVLIGIFNSSEFVARNLSFDLGYKFKVVTTYNSTILFKKESDVEPSNTEDKNYIFFSSICKIAYNLFNKSNYVCSQSINSFFNEKFNLGTDEMIYCNFSYIDTQIDSIDGDYKTLTSIPLNKSRCSNVDGFSCFCQQNISSNIAKFTYVNDSKSCSNCNLFYGFFGSSFFNILNISLFNTYDSGSPLVLNKTCSDSCAMIRSSEGIKNSIFCGEVDSCFDLSKDSCGQNSCLNYQCTYENFNLRNMTTIGICKPQNQSLSRCDMFDDFFDSNYFFTLNSSVEVSKDLCESLGDCVFYNSSSQKDDFYCLSKDEVFNDSMGNILDVDFCNFLGVSDNKDFTFELYNDQLMSILMNRNDDNYNINEILCYNANRTSFIPEIKTSINSSKILNLNEPLDINIYDLGYYPNLGPDKEKVYVNISIFNTTNTDSTLLYNKTYPFKDLNYVGSFNQKRVLKEFNLSDYFSESSILTKSFDICSYFPEDYTNFNSSLKVQFAWFNNSVSKNISLENLYVDCKVPEINFSKSSISYKNQMGTSFKWYSDIIFNITSNTNEKKVYLYLNVTTDESGNNLLSGLEKNPIFELDRDEYFNDSETLNFTLNRLESGIYYLNYYLIDVSGNNYTGSEFFEISASSEIDIKSEKTKTIHSNDDLIEMQTYDNSQCRWSFNNISVINRRVININQNPFIENYDLDFNYSYPDKYIEFPGLDVNVTYLLKFSYQTNETGNISINIFNSSQEKYHSENISIDDIVSSVGYFEGVAEIPIIGFPENEDEYIVNISSNSNVNLSDIMVVQNFYPFTYDAMSNQLTCSNIEGEDDKLKCSFNLKDDVSDFTSHHKIYYSCKVSPGDGLDPYYAGDVTKYVDRVIDKQKPGVFIRYPNENPIALNENTLNTSGFLNATSFELIFKENNILNRNKDSAFDGSFGLSSIQSQEYFGLSSFSKSLAKELAYIESINLNQPVHFCFNVTDGYNKFEDICLLLKKDNIAPKLHFEINDVISIADYYVLKNDYVNLTMSILNAEAFKTDLDNNYDYGVYDSSDKTYLKKGLTNESIFIYLKTKEGEKYLNLKGNKNLRGSSVAFDQDVIAEDNETKVIIISSNDSIRSNIFGTNLEGLNLFNYDLKIFTEAVDYFYLSTFNYAFSDSSIDLGDKFTQTDNGSFSFGELPYVKDINSSIFVRTSSEDEDDFSIGDIPFFIFDTSYNTSNDQNSTYIFRLLSSDSSNIEVQKELVVKKDTIPPIISLDLLDVYEYGLPIEFNYSVNDDYFTSLMRGDYVYGVVNYSIKSINELLYNNFEGFCDNSFVDKDDFNCNDALNYFFLNNTENSKEHIVIERYLNHGDYSLNINASCNESKKTEYMIFYEGKTISKQFNCSNSNYKTYNLDFNLPEDKKVYFILRIENKSYLNISKFSLMNSKYNSPMELRTGKRNINFTGLTENNLITNNLRGNSLGYYTYGSGDYELTINATDYFNNSMIFVQDFEIKDTISPEALNFGAYSTNDVNDSFLTRKDNLIVFIKSSEPLNNANLSINYDGSSKSFLMNEIEGPGKCDSIVDSSSSDCRIYYDDYYYVNLSYYPDLVGILGSANKEQFDLSVVLYDYSNNPSSTQDLGNFGFDTKGLDEFKLYENDVYSAPLFFSQEDIPIFGTGKTAGVTEKKNYNIILCVSNKPLSRDDYQINKGNCSILYESNITDGVYFNREATDYNNYNSITKILNLSTVKLNEMFSFSEPFFFGEYDSSKIKLSALQHTLFEDNFWLYFESDESDYDEYKEGFIYQNFTPNNCNDFNCTYHIYLFGKDEFGNEERDFDNVTIIYDNNTPELNIKINSGSGTENQTYGDSIHNISFNISDKYMEKVDVWYSYELIDGTSKSKTHLVDVTNSRIVLINPNDLNANDGTGEFKKGTYNFTIYARDKAKNILNETFYFSFLDSSKRPELNIKENSFIIFDNTTLFTINDTINMTINYSDPRDTLGDINITEINVSLVSENVGKNILLDEGEYGVTFEDNNDNHTFNLSINLSKLYEHLNDDGSGLVNNTAFYINIYSNKNSSGGKTTPIVHHRFYLLYMNDNISYFDFNNETNPFYTNKANLTYPLKVRNMANFENKRSLSVENITYVHNYSNSTNNYGDLFLNNFTPTYLSGDIDELIFNLDINFTKTQISDTLYQEEGNHTFNITIRDIFNNTHHEELLIILDYIAPNESIDEMENLIYVKEGEEKTYDLEDI